MRRWNDHDVAGGSMFLLGALAGALVGAGAALLMTPKTGAQVREDLNSGLNTVRDAAAKHYRTFAERASETLDRAEQAAGEQFKATQGTAGYQS